MFSVIIAYGIMMVCYYKLLIEYFPKGKGSSFAFLKWIDKYPQLLGVGTFIGIGLYIHMILMWASPIGVQVQGLFYGDGKHLYSAESSARDYFRRRKASQFERMLMQGCFCGRKIIPQGD